MKKIINYIKYEINESLTDFKSIKIKKLEKNKNFSWILILLALIFYELQYYFWPESISNFFLQSLKIPVYGYFLILDVLTLIIVIIAFKNELKESIGNFKIHIKDYLKYLLYTIIVFSSLSAIVMIFCSLIVGEIPENQSSLETYNYFYLIFASLIYAPIVEELIYRGVIRKFIKNDKLFIIISGIIFGLAHVIGSSTLIQYIYLLDYGICGAYMAFLYTKYNNIYLNISAHFIINLIATISVLIRLI